MLEVLIVTLVIGILAAAAVGIYLGYANAASVEEGKQIAGKLWTSVQSNAIGACGTAQTVAGGFAAAGFTAAGATTPARWTVDTGSTNTLTVSCLNGSYATNSPTFFLLRGTTADISSLRVQVNYIPTGGPPNVTMTCSTDSGTSFVPCSQTQ